MIFKDAGCLLDQGHDRLARGVARKPAAPVFARERVRAFQPRRLAGKRGFLDHEQVPETVADFPMAHVRAKLLVQGLQKDLSFLCRQSAGGRIHHLAVLLRDEIAAPDHFVGLG